MTTALTLAATKALSARAGKSINVYKPTDPAQSTAPDLFSNDFLSLTSLPHLREGLLERLAKSERLFGSRGSRLLDGSTSEHVDLESYVRDSCGAPAALMFNSAYVANLAFLGSAPQPGDAIIFDELVHASCYDGMNISRAKDRKFSFDHNSVASFEACLVRVLAGHSQILAGKSTVFIVLESIYSMDGDICPLEEIVTIVEKHVPPAAAHIFVDEAHSFGLCGPQGKGLVKHLGLDRRVQTILHPISKAPNFIGAFILTSPIICQYIANYARPFAFTTSLPHINLIAIRYCLEILASPIGDQLRNRLRIMSLFFFNTLTESLVGIPRKILSLPEGSGLNRKLDLISPIFPVFTEYPLVLQQHLKKQGYSAVAMFYPAVPLGQERIRVIIHASNTENEIRAFIATLRQWAIGQMSQEFLEAKL